MLYTNCILRETNGLYRISVMSRHTLNDGATPDNRLDNRYDIHLPELGPSSKLIGSYYKNGLSFDQFAVKFRGEVRSEPKKYFLQIIAKLALKLDIVLLCIEETPEKCHRKILAEECKIIVPTLQVSLK